MARSAFLLGHLHRRVRRRRCSALAVMTVGGLIVGWRIHTDVPHALAGFALIVLVRVHDALGRDAARPGRALARRGHRDRLHRHLPADVRRQRVRARRGLPGVLQTVAEWNPVSALAAAVRTLFGNPTAAAGDAALAARSTR